MKAVKQNQSCVAQPPNRAAASLSRWIKTLDGRKRVANVLGLDASTLWRYETGELPVPKWLLVMMKLSKENAELKQKKG